MTWGARSRSQADTVYPDLHKVAKRVDARWSSTVLNGRRDAAQQRANVDSGVSRTLESKHLPEHSREPELGVDAIDVAPDPLKWPDLKSRLSKLDDLFEAMAQDGLDADDRRAFLDRIRRDFASYAKDVGRWYAFAGYFHGVADELFERGEIGRPLRHGYDWDGDHRLDDQTFDDLPHHECA